jgi:hypothetical protein
MTRGGNRRDVPTSGTRWIDYSCPVETWDYWEERFKRPFSPELRIAIAKVMFDFRNYSDDWNAEADLTGKERLDSKQIKRSLKAALKNAAIIDPKLRNLVEIHCLDMPEATFAEKVNYILHEYADDPDGFTMEHSMPKPLYTGALYELLRSNDHNVAIYSASTVYGRDGMDPKARKKGVPETPFVEFVRLCIWHFPASSASFCARIRKEVQRLPVPPSL